MTDLAKKPTAANPHPTRASFWCGLMVVAAALGLAAAISWRRWPDLIVDFGGQLYIPWRLAGGAVLYRDLFHMAGGPLSQYYHAALFKIFGPSFLVLVLSNLTVTAALLFLIFQQFQKTGDALTATLIGVTIVIGFAAAQYTSLGNCNYFAPYSHEMLHGLALSVLTLALMADWLAQRKIRCLLAAAFCTGLVALTKPDIFIALTLTLAAGFGIFALTNRPRRPALKPLAIFAIVALIPSAGFYLFFLRTQSWSESLQLVFFGWKPIFISGVVKNPFYQWSLGLDTPFDHLREISLQFLVCALVVLIYAKIFQWLAALAAPWRWLAGGFALVPLLLAAMKFNWPNCGAALPLLTLATAGILFWRWRQNPGNCRWPFPLLWSVFAILLLAKQGVFPRIWHTGFALAMPAFVSAVYLFLRLLPDFLEEKFQIPRGPMRAGAIAILIIALANLANTSWKFYSAKQIPVGHGADLILANGPAANAVEARTLNLALDWIDKNVPPRATLAAVPEGALLNFLSRRVNPTPCLDWNPTILAVFDSSRMTAAFETNAPDYVALVEWQTYEFGIGYFGSQPDYGGNLLAWLHKNYQPVALFGSEPLRNGLFGIKIFKHQTENPATNKIEIQPPIP